jgi:hypothetical protein
MVNSNEERPGRESAGVLHFWEMILKFRPLRGKVTPPRTRGRQNTENPLRGHRTQKLAGEGHHPKPEVAAPVVRVDGAPERHTHVVLEKVPGAAAQT